MKRFIQLLILVILGTFCAQRVVAQISPGELTRAHQHLEGISNCIQCHESGKEISGAKCLACHTEIREAIASKHGFHFANSSNTCLTCHKEHLGKEAKITKFSEAQFDHVKSGFPLKGKHGSLKCEQCHNDKSIKVAAVQKVLSGYPHKTYLGLDPRCISCHTDRHKGKTGAECESCHGTNAWSPAAAFTHEKTKFTLVGKHKTVECAKCHEEARKKGPTDPILFTTKTFADCTPCHANPHGAKFSDKSCRSCHTPEGWKIVVSFNHSTTKFPLTGKHAAVTCEKCHTAMAGKRGQNIDFKTKEFGDCTPCHSSPHRMALQDKQCRSCHTTSSWGSRSLVPFDHSLTKFNLVGKHVTVECEKCHKPVNNSTFARRFFLSHRLCTDCHTDYHEGQFSKKYANDCAQCHTEQTFKPSTFTLTKHAEAKFPLMGAHVAVPCNDCHIKNGATKPTFHFASTRCETCHSDKHKGEFAKFMAELSCGRCHSSQDWKIVSFDHVATRFPLIGKHLGVRCVECHKEQVVRGTKVFLYQGSPLECQSCHTDVHAGQFTQGSVTKCAPCHSPNGWHALVFNHDGQSAFRLTGAHKNVACRNCHKEEPIGAKKIVRYKPLSLKCESCHKEGK